MSGLVCQVPDCNSTQVNTAINIQIEIQGVWLEYLSSRAIIHSFIDM